ncbi:MAG TPA: extracellular solute-binding protein [Chloroflexota bacterium]|nr:extracellular solute-binding protein [Chloroflexota bacterium]
MNALRGRTVRTRRRLLRGASLGVGTGIVAGCARGAGPDAAPSSGASPAAITFLGRESGSEVEVYKQGIERFHGAQARVRVTHELATGNFDQKLQAVVAAGTPPDAHYMHSQTVATYAAMRVPASLDAFARKDRTTLDALLPAAIEAYRFRGAVYGIPDVATSYVLYVSRQLFARAGVPVPAEKWSWAEYQTAAQHLVNALRADQVFATANFTADDSWPAALWQHGADILSQDRSTVTVDRPEAVEAFAWIADQITKTRVHAAPADLGGRTAEQFFLDGKAAMLPTYSSRMGNIARAAQFEVEVVHLPQDKQRVTRTACGGVAMAQATRAPEAAWEFLKFVAGEDFQWSMARTGGIIFPAHKKVVAAPELFAGGQFPASPKVAVDAMAYARTEPYVPRYVEIKGALVKELSTVWSGESAVADATVRAKGAMAPILAEALAQIK